MPRLSKGSELFVAVILLVLVISLTDPIDILMPTPVQMTILVFVVLVYGIFAGFMFHEKPADEREKHLLNTSSRLGYLVGTGVLIAGMVVQSLQHSLDNWLVWTLGAMILTKIIALYRSR